MDLSIVIVNWNSADYVRRCIASIQRTVFDLAYEVIVVDSGSFDACSDMLQSVYPDVRFVQSEVNVGFARANNLGAERARGAALLFLNPDTEVLDGAIARLHGHLAALPDAGVLGGRLLNSDRSLQTSCVQSVPTVLNQVLDAHVLRRLFPRAALFGTRALFAPLRGAHPVDVVSGACMMIRRDVFDRIGRFGADYFMYGEDVDLCVRLRRAGFRNYHVGDAIVVHHGGGSTRRTPSRFAVVMTVASVNRFLQRSQGGAYAATHRVTVTGAALVRLALLGFLFPTWWALDGTGTWRSVFLKWVWILRWGLGLERWTSNYERRDRRGARPDSGSCAASVES